MLSYTAFLAMKLVLKVLASWILFIAGAYFIFSGGLDYYSANKSQTEAAAFWKDTGVDPAPASPVEIIPEPPGRVLPPNRTLRPGEPVARIFIPRLKADLYVIEGTNQSQLHKAPGHMEGTSLPGGQGNCVIAGHRDTHFRVLQNIRKGEEIVLANTHGKQFRYRVTELSVISPSNTKCLQDTQEPVLNLITCYPFHYVGSAPKRFVVHAELESPSSAQSGI